MTTITRKGTTARYSDIVIHNGTAWIVEVPTSETPDVRTQTRELLTALEARLTEAGSSPAHLLSATLYLTDMADYAAVNEIWDAWIPSGTAPSRACLQISALAKPGWKIEIAAIAAVA